jgi:nicotinamide mononucleotide transporter
MNIHEWFTLFADQVKDSTILDWLAVGTGVAEVLLARTNNVLLYPSGIISTALSIYIIACAGLYAESVLNVYYLIMSIYGWAHWLRKKNAPPLPVTHSSKNDWLIASSIALAAFIICYTILQLYMHRYSNSTIAIWDVFVTATAWAGMWLLARRKIENWLVLNISNLFAIPLLLYKKLPLFSCLTLFLFIVAIFGYLEWKKILRAQLIKQTKEFSFFEK